MNEQFEAITLILEQLKVQGLGWYRKAKLGDVELFERRISGGFSILDSGEAWNIGRKPKGSFPAKTILIMAPSRREQEALKAIWLRWDFTAKPIEFRLFLGQWAEINGQKAFIAFRFEAPESGAQHNYYHCQPCRNLGDREPVPGAALISEHFPTIPLYASNIVELTVCALLSSMGHEELKQFFRKLLSQPACASNAALTSAQTHFLKLGHKTDVDIGAKAH